MQSMYYIGLDVHKKTIRRRDSRNTIGSGHLDEETTAAVDGKYRMDGQQAGKWSFARGREQESVHGHIPHKGFPAV